MKRLLPLAVVLAFLHATALAATDPSVVAELLFPVPSLELHTPGAERQTFTTYAEVKSWLDSKAGGGSFSVFSLGKTEQGRDIWAAHFGASGAELRIMVTARVHGNEPASSEAALEFIHALADGDLSSSLEDTEFLVIPVANPDGSAEMKRLPPSGMDINRDYTLTNQPETVMLSAAFRDFDPHVLVDLHEYTVWGRLGEYASPFDLYLAGVNEPNLPAILRDYSETWQARVASSLEQSGLRAARYELLSMDGAGLKVSESATTFVSAKNFMGMPGVLSFLIEVRGIGLGDQHYRRRTAAGYQGLAAIVSKAVSEKEQLLHVVSETRKQILAAKSWELDRLPVKQNRTYPLVSRESGGVVELPAQFVNRSGGKPGLSVEVPDAYLLPASCRSIIARLRRMGVEVRQLKETVLVEVEVQTIDAVKPAGNLYAGQKRQSITATTSQAMRAFAKGDYVVPTRQRNRLYLQVLEAASPSGFAALGLVGDQPGVETPFYRLRTSLPKGSY